MTFSSSNHMYLTIKKLYCSVLAYTPLFHDVSKS